MKNDFQIRIWLRAVSLIFLFSFVIVSNATAADNELCGQIAVTTIQVTRGNNIVGEFLVVLADSPAKYREGLMHCRRLAPGGGMLFLYEKSAQRVFWMKNTMLDLAIIFISDSGRITAIRHGKPGSLKHITSREKSRMILEINYNESRHIALGDRVNFQRPSYAP